MITFEVLRNTPYTYQFQATGQVYHAWYEIANIGSGNTLYLEMRQTNSRIVHVLDYLLRSNSNNMEIEVYKDASFTAGDVRMNWSAYNHRITKAPTLELYQNPTSVNLSGATQTHKGKGYGNALGNQLSSSAIAPSVFLEEMLEEGEDYLIAITNNDSQGREFFFHMAWYESGN